MVSTNGTSAAPAPMSALANLIQEEIHRHGPMPFSRFMELALYHPEFGYYERSVEQIGCHGDYVTSVAAGRLFGELLAFQFTEWFDELDSSRPPDASDPLPAFDLVEAGAHDGRLAADILHWIRHNRPELESRITYHILEPSPRRREHQATMLARHPGQVRWIPAFDPAPRTYHGILFCNELLDALPVARIGWDARAAAWFEWGVTWSGHRFDWIRMNHETKSPPAIRDLNSPYKTSQRLAALLPDGFTTESYDRALQWWKTAARTLRRGKLLTLDYGLNGLEFLRPDRAGGTLRAYSHQHQTADLLSHPGEQDLTAHVDFESLQSAGEAEGLATSFFGSQESFLGRIAERLLRNPATRSQWNSEQKQTFQFLTHPDHLGRAFKVLVQERS